MADVDTLVEYYSNLLIVQYHNKPKAKAMIELLVREMLAEGIAFQVQEGYNLDTAVGKQLDIIGKYVGIDRFYQSQDLHDYFSFTFYDEAVIPADKWGFSDYADYDLVFENGTLNYNSVLVNNFSLNDDDYRTLIRLKIIQNNSNHSHQSIDDALFRFFGSTVRADSQGDMHMIYFVPSNMTQIIQAAIAKKVLPRPMGVGVLYIAQSNTFFGFGTYDYGVTPLITGFTTYADYASKLGETLKYDDIGQIT